MTPLIAITGGIGSGKSAVCRCLATWGFPVYDCDSNAKRIMDNDREIHREIAREISPEAIIDNRIDRPRLAEIVFTDPSRLAALNRIVHSRVIADIRDWRASQSALSPICFVETAILLESNLHLEVDQVWLVEAEEEIRVQRASLRDNRPTDAIRQRIANQRSVTPADLPCPLHIIDNNGVSPVIPRLLHLLSACMENIGTSGQHPLCSSLPIPGRQWKN